MIVETCVEGAFCAAHKGPFCATLHGHSWRVKAWFRQDAKKPRNAVELKRALNACLYLVDHKTLDEVFTPEVTDESLAVWLLKRLTGAGCVEVELIRQLEGQRTRARL